MLKNKPLFYIHIIAVCILTLIFMPGTYGAQLEDVTNVPDDSFMIAVKQDESIITENVFNLAELSDLPQTRLVYTSIDDEGTPQLILAEGITLTNLMKVMGVELADVKSLKLYSREGWDKAYSTGFLFDVERFVYPDILPQKFVPVHPDNSSIKPDAEVKLPFDDDKARDDSTEHEEASADLIDADSFEGSEMSEEVDQSSDKVGSEDDSAKLQETVIDLTSADSVDSSVMPQESEPSSNDVGPEDDSTKLQETVSDITGEVSAEDKNAKEEFKQGIVAPILALKYFEEINGTSLDWNKLRDYFGIRICYGQLTRQDVCSPMFGNDYYKMEIILKDSPKGVGNESSEFSEYYEDDEDDFISGDDQTISNLPRTLTIRVGYFGEEYTERKIFTLAEMSSLPKIKQNYSLVGENNTIIMESAIGVRLVDILAASGIDPESTQYLHFYGAGSQQNSVVSMSNSFLLDTPRYFYPRLSEGDAKGLVTARAIRVDTIIALRDNWQASATVPDFYKVNANNRFRLVLGQENPETETASYCVPYIHTIEIQLAGKNPEQPISDTEKARGGKIPIGMDNARGNNNTKSGTENNEDKNEVNASLNDSNTTSIVNNKNEVSAGSLIQAANAYDNAAIYKINANTIVKNEPVPAFNGIYAGIYIILMLILGIIVWCIGYRAEIN